MNSRTAGMLLTISGGLCWGMSGCMGQYMFSVLGMDSQWTHSDLRVFLQCSSLSRRSGNALLEK